MDLHIPRSAPYRAGLLLVLVGAFTLLATLLAPAASAQFNTPGIKAAHAVGDVVAQSAEASQVPDGAAVTVTNSFQSPGDPEEIFAGPESAQVDDGTEFVGFGGFDIDVSEDMIVMTWSDDDEFDEFEGPFEGGFRDIFIFELPGLDFEAEVDEAANLVPEVNQIGSTVRVVFTDGMEYADGKVAVIELIAEEPEPEPEPEPEEVDEVDEVDEVEEPDEEDDEPAALADTGAGEATFGTSIAIALVLGGGFFITAGRRNV